MAEPQAPAAAFAGWDTSVFMPMPGCTCGACSDLRKRPSDRADQRAWELLRSFLTEDQREELKTRRTITVAGSDGKTFVIMCSRYSENVAELWNGQVRRIWCCYPHYSSRRVPLADLLLGQFLALKTNAVRFRQIGF